MNRDHQDDDLQALRRLLPVPTERDFPAGRQHQREEHLMTSWLTMSRRTDKRRNLGVRIALPAGLAAAAAGIALTALPTQTAAAYTLQNTDDGTVKLTIVDPSGKIGLAELQKELDELGVNSRVYAGDPDCPAPSPGESSDASYSGTASDAPSPGESSGAPYSGTASDAPSPGRTADSSPSSTEIRMPQQPREEGWEIGSEHGKPVLYVNPSKIPADGQLRIVFPLAKIDPAHAYGVIVAGLGEDPGPACMPAAVQVDKD